MPTDLPSPVTAFDSSTVPLDALAHFLNGRDYQVLGMSSPLSEAISSASALLPMRVREWLYQRGGRKEAVDPEKLREFDAEKIAGALAAKYPERQYPAIAIGSSNGAIIHLCAALDIPWLPQNLLVLVRRDGLDPDEPRKIMESGREVAEPLLAAAPDIALHHMVDPTQDRLMGREALYFRLKRLRLGRAYESFITRHLAPGGTLFTVECDLRWPVKRVADRHVFQFGGVGGLAPDEYLRGSDRVTTFLRSQGAAVPRWHAPEPGEQAPEAEWGFAPELLDDARRFADLHGYKIQRLRFATPEVLSPIVADLYRWWYRRRSPGAAKQRLVVESFFLIDPWCVIRTGAIPFWTVFNAEGSTEALERYLDRSEAFEDIYMVIFSNGIRSPGLAPIERWLSALRRAKGRGQLLGVDPGAYPKDFQVFFRYHRAMQKIPPLGARPEPLALDELAEFLKSANFSVSG